MPQIELVLETRTRVRSALVLKSMPTVGRLERAEAWIEVHMADERIPEGLSAGVQPQSFFQAALGGRPTALLCQGGILALSVNGNQVCVDYYGPKNLTIHGLTSVTDLTRALMIVTQPT